MPAAAQEPLHGTLYVEGEYVPTIVRQDKIHLLPHKADFSMPTMRNEADTRLLTTDYPAFYLALPAPVWHGTLKPYPYRGYLTAGLGSYLNSTLSAGYLLANSASTRADLWLQHTGTSLMHPRMNQYSRDWKRYRYDERLGFTLRHDMGSGGTLDLAATYRLGLFNYYGATPHPDLATPGSPGATPPDAAPRQTLNDAALNAAWHSASTSGFSFSAHVGAAYFGYNRNYTVADYHWLPWKGQKETEANAGGSLTHKLAEGSVLTADVDFTLLAYNKAVSNGRSRTLQTLTFTPAYVYTDERFSARLGVRADATWGAGASTGIEMPDLDYSTLHLAPSVRLAYDASLWSALLDFGGGQQLQTLRQGALLNYYQKPMLDYVMPQFTPLKALLRLQYAGTGKLAAGVDFTWAVVRHLYLGGWYMSQLSDYTVDAADFMPLHCNLRGFSLGADVRWNPLSMLSLKGRLTWQPQKNLSTTGFFNGYDRPRWTIDAEATLTPIRPLTLSLSYHYRGVRNIYSRYGVTRQCIATRLPDLCLLNFGARYRLNRSVAFFASADNMLARRVNILPCTPSEGVNFMAGADVLF